MTAADCFWWEDKDGISIRVRLTPRGGRDALEGTELLADGQAVLKARVRAAPEKGLANAALEKLIADALGLPKSAISVVAGGTGRIKTLRLLASPADSLERWRNCCEHVASSCGAPFVDSRACGRR